MSLAGLLNQTISLYGKSGYNEQGRETVGALTSVFARVQVTSKRRLLPNGSIVTIDAIAYLPASTSINTDDKVTYSGNDYKVFAKYTAVDGEGQTNHIKVELVKWAAT